eukprot:6199279-Pleurochrysis_carterae.AAC.5
MTPTALPRRHLRPSMPCVSFRRSWAVVMPLSTNETSGTLRTFSANSSGVLIRASSWTARMRSPTWRPAVSAAPPAATLLKTKPGPGDAATYVRPSLPSRLPTLIARFHVARPRDLRQLCMLDVTRRLLHVKVDGSAY